MTESELERLARAEHSLNIQLELNAESLLDAEIAVEKLRGARGVLLVKRRAIQRRREGK